MKSCTAASSRCTLRAENVDTLLRVDGGPLAALPSDPLYFRDTEMVSLSTGTVRGIAFESGGRQLSVQIDATNAAPNAVVLSTLDALRSLRAKELVSKDTSNLTAYGLAPPQAKITAVLTGTNGLSKILMLGSPAPGGGHYAAVQGLDLIFTLEDSDWEKLLAPLAAAPPIN